MCKNWILSSCFLYLGITYLFIKNMRLYCTYHLQEFALHIGHNSFHMLEKKCIIDESYFKLSHTSIMRNYIVTKNNYTFLLI